MNAEKMVSAIKILLEYQQARIFAERDDFTRKHSGKINITECEEQLYILEELIESCREGWEEI